MLLLEDPDGCFVVVDFIADVVIVVVAGEVDEADAEAFCHACATLVVDEGEGLVGCKVGVAFAVARAEDEEEVAVVFADDHDGAFFPRAIFDYFFDGDFLLVIEEAAGGEDCDTFVHGDALVLFDCGRSISYFSQKVNGC